MVEYVRIENLFVELVAQPWRVSGISECKRFPVTSMKFILLQLHSGAKQRYEAPYDTHVRQHRGNPIQDSIGLVRSHITHRISENTVGFHENNIDIDNNVV